MLKKTNLIIRSFAIFIALIAFTIPAKATFYMGGEITWECLPSGQFVFKLKHYRECNAINFPNNLTLLSNSPAGYIPMSLVNGWPKDITPQCNPNPNFTHITCANVIQSNLGAIDEWVYKTAPVTLNGVPPVTGWEFYLESCCRNPSSNIVGQPSWKLRAKMYPFNNHNTYPCFDSSPIFAESARSVIDVGYPFVYSQNVYDPELDSLDFEWGEPLQWNSLPVNYVSGYSWMNPLPGPTQNINNGVATINHKTGVISINSHTSGAFVTSIKVNAYKCGVLVSETWSEMQIVLRANTNSNTPPELTPPFNNGTSYTTSVYAGDLITFNISASDSQYLPSTPPTPQTVSIEAFGRQFGDYIAPSGSNPATMSTSTGCLNPPCATLTPAPEPGSPISNVTTNTTTFSWQTTCGHVATNIGCGATTNEYRFLIKVSDDYCPFPAEKTFEIKIEVLTRDSLNIDGPKINCIKVLNDTSLQIIWNKITFSDSIYDEYRVYSDSGGTYNLVGKTYNNDTSIIVNNKLNSMDFKVAFFSACATNEKVGGSFSSIFLKAYQISGNKTMLNWNAPLDSLPLNYTDYYVYKSTSANNWSLITTTSNTSFMDTLSHNIDSVKYRVEISNSICTSTSNEATILPSGIEESDLSEKIKIYPNPAKDFLKLEWESDLQIDLVEVYNTSSQLVLKQEIRPSDRNAQLDLKGLSKGVYIVILKGDGINYLEKVLIE